MGERRRRLWGDGAQASAVVDRLAAIAAERVGEEREPRRLLREREGAEKKERGGERSAFRGGGMVKEQRGRRGLS